MDYTLLIMGIIALIIGIGLRYWINKRKFNRRNAAGLESFSNYEKAVGIRFIERIGKLIAWILILAGLLFLWGYSMEKKRREKSKEAKTVSIRFITASESLIS